MKQQQLSRTLSCLAVSLIAVLTEGVTAQSEWWARVDTKGASVAVNPKDGTAVPMMFDRAVISPDRKHKAYLSMVPGSSDTDLFVAEYQNPMSMLVVRGDQGARQITNGIRGIVDIQWMPDNVSLVFASAETGQVYTVRTDGPAATIPKPTQISKGDGTCYKPTVSPDGRIAWFVERSRNGKERLSDLVITTKNADHAAAAQGEPVQSQDTTKKPVKQVGPSVPMPPAPKKAATTFEVDIAPAATTTVVKSTDLFSMQFSADGSKLAYGTIGSLNIHDFASGTTRIVKLTDVSDKLYAHYPTWLAWKPDGSAIAASFHFAGGRSAGFNPDKPNEPTKMPVLFGDNEIFFVPVSDEEKPWWVTGPEGAIGLGWIEVPAGMGKAK